MIENRYHETLRKYNQDILDLSPANQTMRVELALEIKKILEQKPDLKVLEIGVGEGDLTKYLLQYNPGMKLDCLDISSDMIDSAKKNLGEGNVRFIQDDAYEYLDKVETNPYGIITSAWTIHNFPWEDKMKLFKKIFEKLQDGGIMIMMDKIYPDNLELSKQLFNLQNVRYRYLPREAKEAIIDHEVQDFNSDYYMFQAMVIEKLKIVGFRDIEILDRIERDVILVAKK